MPPLSRNQRTPTAGDTPALTPASSLEDPRPTAFQNRCRCSRRPTGGRPGDRIGGRPARSARRRLLVPIATPHCKVLRRPLESALAAGIGVADQPVQDADAPPDGHLQGVQDQFGALLAAARQPTISREKTSITNARYTVSDQVAT